MHAESNLYLFVVSIGASAFGGALDFSFPKATTNVSPDVRAFVSAGLVTAGGDVTIQAISNQHVEAYGDNVNGGILAVGDVDSNVNLTNQSIAFVGTGTQIIAGNTFELSTDFTTEGTVHAGAAGGGFIARFDHSESK